MPLIKSAIKKLRKDRTRTRRHKQQESNLKSLIKKARIEKNDLNLKAVFSALDKAAKTHLIHKNKSARLKSTLSRLPKVVRKTSKK
ncbi:30S ribosomal protein S20 [Candidatus Daviesbacteria bacterium]|nr:30S ribosomal protein S20 [Candidatus Daviesbacteria bacterium]